MLHSRGAKSFRLFWHHKFPAPTDPETSIKQKLSGLPTVEKNVSHTKHIAIDVKKYLVEFRAWIMY